MTSMFRLATLLAAALTGFAASAAQAGGQTFSGEMAWTISRTMAPGVLEVLDHDLTALSPLPDVSLLAHASVQEDPLGVMNTGVSHSMVWRAQVSTGTDGGIEHARTPGGFSLGTAGGRYSEFRSWHVDIAAKQVLMDIAVSPRFEDTTHHDQVSFWSLSNERIINARGDALYDLRLTEAGTAFTGLPAGQAFGVLALSTVTAPVPEAGAAWMGLFGLAALACARRPALARRALPFAFSSPARR